LHGSDVNPGFGARDRSLEILRQSAVSIEPSKGSFNDPSAWQQLKADGVSGAFDDFDGKFTIITPINWNFSKRYTQLLWTLAGNATAFGAGLPQPQLVPNDDRCVS